MAKTTFSGPVQSNNGFIGSTTLPAYTVSTTTTISTPAIGQVIYVSNGLAGDPTLAVYNGTNWIASDGATITSA